MENEQNKISLGIGERLKVYSPDFSLSTNKMVETYLANNLPELITKHDLALKNDLMDVETSTVKLEGRVEDLEAWKGETATKIGDSRVRVEILEKKHGIKG